MDFLLKVLCGFSATAVSGRVITFIQPPGACAFTEFLGMKQIYGRIPAAIDY
ncbi:MAG: hypothetical protein ACK41V_05155 [Acidovorax sp.]|uniref:hypothetical protein n=1 Tax=Acidovorax sp. TaxID=1872122 RepID=UPI00391DB0A8